MPRRASIPGEVLLASGYSINEQVGKILITRLRGIHPEAVQHQRHLQKIREILGKQAEKRAVA